MFLRLHRLDYGCNEIIINFEKLKYFEESNIPVDEEGLVDGYGTDIYFEKLYKDKNRIGDQWFEDCITVSESVEEIVALLSDEEE